MFRGSAIPLNVGDLQFFRFLGSFSCYQVIALKMKPFVLGPSLFSPAAGYFVVVWFVGSDRKPEEMQC